LNARCWCVEDLPWGLYAVGDEELDGRKHLRDLGVLEAVVCKIWQCRHFIY
jgi:hypothetical protein